VSQMNDTTPGGFDRVIAERMRGAVGERPAVPIYPSVIPRAKRHGARWVGGAVGVLAAGAVVAVVIATAVPGRVPAVPAAPPASPSVSAPTVSPTEPVTQAPAPPMPGWSPRAKIVSTGIAVNPDVTKAPHSVVLYFDYHCPSCANFEETYGTALEHAAQTGKVSLEYRSVTFLDFQGQDSSTRAAVAAACAVDAGAYLPYHNQLMANAFDEERSLTDVQLRDDFPRAVGITGGALVAFQACYDNRDTQAFVKSVNDAALKAGVNGVPAVEVDGKMADDYAAAMDKLLGK